jgi:hypothetical protein
LRLKDLRKGDFPTKWEISLNPDYDSSVKRGLTNLTEQEFLKTILCHELGHFVGMCFHDPSQHPLYQALNGKTQGEKNAWDNAAAMGITLDPTVRRRCLASYLSAEEEEKQDYLLNSMRKLVREALSEDPKMKWLLGSEALPRKLHKFYVRSLLFLACMALLCWGCGAHAAVRGDAVNDQYASPVGAFADMGSLFAGALVIGGVRDWSHSRPQAVPVAHRPPKSRGARCARCGIECMGKRRGCPVTNVSVACTLILAATVTAKLSTIVRTMETIAGAFLIACALVSSLVVFTAGLIRLGGGHDANS